MAYKLSVFNPSNYWRGGDVAAPWQPIGDATGISPDAFQLLEAENGKAIPAQIDRIDPSDQRLDTLAFVLPYNAAPGPEDYSQSTAAVYLESVGAPKAKRSTAAAEPVGLPARVELANQELTLSISLSASQDESKRDWFAGSAQSVRMGPAELLDFWVSVVKGRTMHDPEKRCMQVDRLMIPKPAWANEPEQEVSMFNRPYWLVSYCAGPVRQACTIASEPFEYICIDPFDSWRTRLECTFYRTLILYDRADYLIEELWLKGRVPEGKGESVDLLFSARYFSYMDLGFDPVIYRYDDVPDWFAIECPRGGFYPTYGYTTPGYGYGFATDVHARQLRHPHPGYPVWGKSYKTFSWELHPCKKARCLHLFQLDGPDSIESRTGHAWYEEIYKPLNKVELERGK